MVKPVIKNLDLSHQNRVIRLQVLVVSTFFRRKIVTAVISIIASDNIYETPGSHESQKNL